MGKPNYRVTVSFDRERNIYSARAPELEHLSGEGANRAAAIAALEVEIDAQLANMLSHGTTPPRAVDDTEFSGELTAKVSKALHRDLCLLARSDGIEVDQLVGELLAGALASRNGARGGGRTRSAPVDASDDIGNRVDGNQGGNHGGANRRNFGRGNFNSQILDDRANFIEYVRGLEQGGNQGNQGNHARHGGGHGGGGHGGGGQGGGRGGHGGHGGQPGGGDHRGRRRGGGGRGGPPGQGGRDGNRTHGGGQGHGGSPQAPRPAPLPAAAAPPAASDSDSHEG